ncbi:hypothetical protein AB0L40_24545, partial [Patulibacter sp. NPDC049589]
RVPATIKMIVYTLVGSLLMLVAAIAVGAGRSGIAGFGALGGSTALNVDAGAGGGGGGGLFGGSGGLPGSGGGSNGGGGGAGSSGFGGSAVNGSLSQTTDEPQVTISFTDPPKPTTTTTTTTDTDTTTDPPVLEDLHASPSTFKAAATGGSLVTSTKKGTGTRLTWSVDTASMTTFDVLAARTGRKAGGSCVAPKAGKAVAKKDRCTRFVPVGSFVHEDLEGENTARFTGRVKGHKLAKGSYRLEATPSLDDVEGDAVRTPFTIK